MDKKATIDLLVNEIGSLSDLISSLSIAVCGGIVAIFLQFVFHNAQNPSKIILLKRPILLVFSFFCETISVLFGYVTKASVLTHISFFQNRTLIDNIPLGAQPNMEFMTFIQFSSIIQFILFIFGIFIILFFLITNRHLISIVKQTEE